MRKWLTIAGFTLLHLFVSSVAIATSFTSSMRRFDTGIPSSPTLREHVWSTLSNLLVCPLYPLSQSLNLHLGRFDYLLFFLNSLLWGVALYWLSTLLFRRRVKPAAKA